MKILLLNQFFWPDAAPTAQLLGDVARDLAERGHEVTVLCGSSAYSAGKSAEPAPPVNIVRTPAAPFAHGRIAKLLSYASFFAGALIRTLRMSRPDVVLCLTTPPFLAVLGWLIRKLRGARYYIWEMDLYPEVAVDLGFLKPKSGLTRALLAMSRAVRSHADGVIALGPCMRERRSGAACRSTRYLSPKTGRTQAALAANCRPPNCPSKFSTPATSASPTMSTPFPPPCCG